MRRTLICSIVSALALGTAGASVAQDRSREDPTGFRQDAIQGGQQRQPTQADVVDRARAPDSPIRNEALVGTPDSTTLPAATPAPTGNERADAARKLQKTHSAGNKGGAFPRRGSDGNVPAGT